MREETSILTKVYQRVAMDTRMKGDAVGTTRGAKDLMDNVECYIFNLKEPG